MQFNSLEQHIEIGVHNERYAIKIDDIHEIIKMQDITVLPTDRFHVKGVINLRGKVVPVISLRSLFGLPEAANTKQTRIVVVTHRTDTVGIVVDRVDKVTTFADIQPAPEQFGGVSGNYFAGVGMMGNGLVGILKVDELLQLE